MRDSSTRWGTAAPWILGGIVLVAAGTMSILRYLSCSNTNFDLAFYTRIVWGLTYGDRFNPLIGAHDLGLHLSPVLYVYVPFALLLPIPLVLLVSQALVLGGCVPVVHRIALRKTGSRSVALAFAAGWLLFPAVLSIGAKEFHPGTLALLPLLLAYDCIDRRSILPAAAFLAAATLCREDVALAAAAAGILVILQGGRARLWGSLILFAGLAWFLVYTLAVQPHYLPPRGSIEEHFPRLGHTAGEVILTALSRPLDILGGLAGLEKVVYIVSLLFPLALLSLLSPVWLILALPSFAINVLSQFPDAARVESHYATLIIPAVFMSALGGAAKVIAAVRARAPDHRSSATFISTSVAVLVVLCSLAAQYAQGALPGARGFEKGVYWWGKNNGTLCWYAAELREDKGLSVLAPYGALAHLADRRRVYSIDFVHPKPDAAILDISQRTWVQVGIDRWQEPWELETEKLEADPRYGLWKSNPPYQLLWKGKPGGKKRHAGISLAALPDGVRLQTVAWTGAVQLEAIEGYLRIRSEPWSGEYEQCIRVFIVFYWRALTRLPADLFVKVRLTGRGKTQDYVFRPTFGARKTGTWKKSEIIRDSQSFVSPGGWPLEEIAATVMFVDAGGNPYPSGAQPQPLVWPEWEARRDR